MAQYINLSRATVLLLCSQVMQCTLDRKETRQGGLLIYYNRSRKSSRAAPAALSINPICSSLPCPFAHAAP